MHSGSEKFGGVEGSFLVENHLFENLISHPRVAFGALFIILEEREAGEEGPFPAKGGHSHLTHVGIDPRRWFVEGRARSTSPPLTGPFPYPPDLGNRNSGILGLPP